MVGAAGTVICAPSATDNLSNLFTNRSSRRKVAATEWEENVWPVCAKQNRQSSRGTIVYPADQIQSEPIVDLHAMNGVCFCNRWRRRKDVHFKTRAIVRRGEYRRREGEQGHFLLELRTIPKLG